MIGTPRTNLQKDEILFELLSRTEWSVFMSGYFATMAMYLDRVAATRN